MQVQNEEKSSLEATEEPQEDSPEPGSPAPTIDPSEELAQQMQYEYMDEVSFQEQIEAIIAQSNEETKYPVEQKPKTQPKPTPAPKQKIGFGKKFKAGLSKLFSRKKKPAVQLVEPSTKEMEAVEMHDEKHDVMVFSSTGGLIKGERLSDTEIQALFH